MKIRRTGNARKNIEDRRGAAPPRSGGGMALKGGIGGLILMVVLALVGGGSLLGGGGEGGSGINLPDVLGQLQPAAPAQGEAPIAREDDSEAELVDWVGYVLNDVQDFWGRQFSAAGSQHEEAVLVVFRDAVASGCGNAPAAAGPFYCPLDKKIYLDLSFFEDLENRFGAPGDFAGIYVIAHEVAHHIQNLTGVNPAVRQEQQANPGKANELSVRQELQADCLSGVWASSAFERDLLEPGDIEEAIGAATAVGDDRIQRQAGMQINPETWTHGSSEQRVEWFMTGFESGDPGRCDTFSGGY